MLLLPDDGAAEDLADLAEDIFGREAELAMRRCAFEKRLGSFLVENARVDRPVVQFHKRKQRSERDAAVSSAKRTVSQQGEKKGRHFVGKRRIRFATQGRDLRPLHGVDQSELRLDHSRMRLRSAELDADRAMQLDQILNREIANAAVSR